MLQYIKTMVNNLSSNFFRGSIKEILIILKQNKRKSGLFKFLIR